MPPRRNQRRPSRPRNTRSRVSRGPSLTSSAPFRPRAGALEARITTERVMYTDFTTFTSTGAGVIQPVINLSDPSAGQDWASFVALYREFRCVGAQITFRPDNRYSKTTTTCRPIAGVIDLNDDTALTGYGQALTYDSHRLLSLEDPWVFNWRLKRDDPRSNTWLDTSGFSSPDGSFKFFASGLSLSTEYGCMVIVWLVQFRGRA